MVHEKDGAGHSDSEQHSNEEQDGAEQVAAAHPLWTGEKKRRERREEREEMRGERRIRTADARTNPPKKKKYYSKTPASFKKK